MNTESKEVKQSSISSATAWRPWSRAKPRAVAIHLNVVGVPEQQLEFRDATALQDALNQRARSDETPKRSIYILEALSHNFVTVLENHFQLHPTVLQDHERHVPLYKRTTGEAVGVPLLPSATCGRNHVSLKYHEPLLFRPEPIGFRNLCNVSGRHISVTRVMGEFSEVGVARRKCTMWSRRIDQGGWDCLIVCDPPVRRVLTNLFDHTGYNVTTLPYNGGYLDFMRHRTQFNNLDGPPRTSVLDDIVFYINNHFKKLDLTSPRSLKTLAETIIASHYLKLAEFLHMVIEVVQTMLSRRQHLSSFDIAVVEEQWSDVQALERRIGEYKDDIETIMLQLQIPFDESDLRHSQQRETSASATDYRFLRLRFRELGERANGLNGSIAALASLTNNLQTVKAQELALEAAERSIREARSMKTLTTLGIIFIPLAYVASLFGMSDPYRPGGRLFWVYFVVAIPLIGLIVLGYCTLELGYSHEHTQWSLESAVNGARQKLRSRNTTRS